jgi:hypothetical protein
MYNGKYYYYGTPLMCWYENAQDDDVMYYSQNTSRDNIIPVNLRRRQPSQQSVPNRYGSQGSNRFGNNRDLNWNYSPSYFQGSSGTTYLAAKAGKGMLPGAKASKTSKSHKGDVIWLYPFDDMYNVICLPGVPPQQADDYPYDDEYYDDEYTDDVKPTKRPTPNNKPSKKPVTKPKPSSNIKTPQPTTDDDTPTQEVRCPAGCPDCDPDSPLPCPPPEMKRICDKSDKDANFRDCYQMCKPSFCCIHDSESKEYSPSCTEEYENCFLYYPCYIIWYVCRANDTRIVFCIPS